MLGGLKVVDPWSKLSKTFIVASEIKVKFPETQVEILLLVEERSKVKFSLTCIVCLNSL